MLQHLNQRQTQTSKTPFYACHFEEDLQCNFQVFYNNPVDAFVKFCVCLIFF